MSHVSIDLGFAEKCEPWKLESRLFPSKIGGKPAWLNLDNLPSCYDLQCSICNRQMIFLCQIYAPYEEDESNFHRTIFIFICRNSQCSVKNTNNNVKVFRSHLQQHNKFYSKEPPIEEPDLNFSLNKWVKLCNLCGCVADKSCSKCKIGYCCRDHQVMDWKEGHKTNCGHNESNNYQSKTLFNEYELVIDTETEIPKVTDEKQAWEEYEKLQNEGKVGNMTEISETELEAHSNIDEDPTFSRFRKYIQNDSDQVLRYDRGGIPLLIANDPVPSVIPNCEACDGPRQFEFQIMPQMLSILQENELDWGVLIVYSCKNSCADGNTYKNEFIFRQDVSVNKTNK